MDGGVVDRWSGVVGVGVVDELLDGGVDVVDGGLWPVSEGEGFGFDVVAAAGWGLPDEDPGCGLVEGEAGVGFGAVVSAAAVAQVRRGGRAVWCGDGVVVVAAVRGAGAGGPAAGAIADVDGEPEQVGREPAELGDVEQIPALVGEQPVEQGVRPGGEVTRERGRHGG